MNYVEQDIVLRTESRYGRDIPLTISSAVFRRLENTARPSVRMALEGTSASVGAPPAWLERASDIRTLGFSALNGDTIVHLKAPKLVDAAPRLFEQRSLWPASASPDDTALQLIGKVSVAVRKREVGSDLYDRALLKHLANWGALFRQELRSVDFQIGMNPTYALSALDQEVVTNAQSLGDQTPSPRQVRLVGKLDMVRHSTRSFGLLLDDGVEIRGVLVEGTPTLLQDYFGKEITVLGRAVYRPSGSLLRVDAAEILPASEGRQVFSKVPQSLAQPRRVERKIQAAKSGVASFFGAWPGEETDRDLLRALEEIRS